MLSGADWRRRLGDLTAGGSWSRQVTPAIRHNLRWFWLDGVFAQVTESIATAYAALFVLALGASSAQIGWLSALSNLAAAGLLLPGGLLAGRPERRQPLCLGAGAAARLVLIALAVIPWLWTGPASVTLAIALVVGREALVNISLPAWTALTADLIPLAWRGRYFGARNIAMGLAGMAATLLVGQLIAGLPGVAGYQAALLLAAGAGLVSVACFARLVPPPAAVAAPAPGPAGPRDLWSELRAQPGFLAFTLAAGVWNFALNLAGPFFNVYVIQGLGGDAGIVGLLSVATTFSSLPGLRLFGALSDRWGPRRVQLLTGLLIPGLPLAWTLVTEPWHPLFINLPGGFLWAGFQLASFNLLLAVTPEARRPWYTALYQIVVLGSLAAGAAVGGLVVTAWGYPAVFGLSCLGRLVAMGLFARFVPHTPPETPAH